MPYISINEFERQCDEYFKRLDFKFDNPIFNIGASVKTKSDFPQSYISTVIGAGARGIVMSRCSIPLIDFGDKIGKFYVCQKKLIQLTCP